MFTRALIKLRGSDIQGVNFTIPKSLPSGQYLLRLEQIALHVAGTYQGAQVSFIPRRLTYRN